jgi:hypothetical protein
MPPLNSEALKHAGWKQADLDTQPKKMTGNFIQIHLADMEHGLAKTFGIISLSPKRIAEMTGVPFETAYEDGCGYVLAALMVSDKGKQISLRQYYQGRLAYPDRTELIGSERSRNPAGDTAEFLRFLGLGREFLAWQCD